MVCALLSHPSLNWLCMRECRFGGICCFQCFWYLLFLIRSIGIHPKGRTIGKHFSMYLMFKGLDDKSYNKKFSLSVFNQKDHQKTVRQSGQYTRNTGSGFSSVVLLSDLHDPAKGFIIEDTCIIQAEITFVMSNAFNVEVPLSTAGKPFEGDGAVVFYDDNFEIVGNFSVLKRQAS
ncbi:uncharacterized protein LOC113290198 isoform X1 [Papaver somniferum]|uniref:uncharacterized protein LOC113290198 isoform X1 n=1 Tax=Papaver somniferum TaxID=3469 RepID=UPI000E6FF953|nr:uncharacterized protein LOC113290198 isoform X1 [Papaver somniferum]